MPNSLEQMTLVTLLGNSHDGNPLKKRVSRGYKYGFPNGPRTYLRIRRERYGSGAPGSSSRSAEQLLRPAPAPDSAPDSAPTKRVLVPWVPSHRCCLSQVPECVQPGPRRGQQTGGPKPCHQEGMGPCTRTHQKCKYLQHYELYLLIMLFFRSVRSLQNPPASRAGSHESVPDVHGRQQHLHLPHHDGGYDVAAANQGAVGDQPNLQNHRRNTCNHAGKSCTQGHIYSSIKHTQPYNEIFSN